MGLFSKNKSGGRTGPVRILLVDDSRVVQIAMQFDIREELGYEVLLASDGESGVKLAEKERPDVILMDYQLPGISGLEACRLLKKNPKTSSIPIIMFTAETGMDIVEKAMGLGAAGYLTKPVKMAMLNAKIALVLGTDAPPARPAAAPQPESPKEEPRPIPYYCSCGKHLVYIPQYKQYYCFSCNTYPPVQPPPPAVSRRCPSCGGELSFLHDHGRWHCLICQK